MTRHPEWPERLNAALEQWRMLDFKWGERDCAHFALACLEAVSGRDWQQLAHEQYHTKRGAQGVLRRLGANNIAALADAVLGARIPAALVSRGDLAVLASPDGPALGVCTGEHVAAMGVTGLVFKPRAAMRAGWRI